MRFPLETSSVEALGFDAKPLSRLRELITAHIAEGRYCWADPDSGVSFAYLTNSRVPDPWHSARLDRVSNLVHTAIV